MINNRTLLIDVEKSEVKSSDDIISIGSKLNVGKEHTDPQLKLKPRNIINVVDKFSWYAGTRATSAALARVPKAFIIEREQQVSSLVAGALYYISAATKPQGLSVSGEGFTGKVTSLLKSINIDSMASGTLAFIEKFRSKFVNGMGDDNLLTNSNLKSLIGIYLTEPTGFKYCLPYFDSMPNISNSWSPGGSNSGLQSFANSGMEAIEEIANIAFINQPGVYIQKPQYYEFNDMGKSITINFPLFNTVNRSTRKPYQLNYELLWLLAFQNKPYKTSFARTPPPKIYSLNIPGICAFPYSFISDMSIDFKGTVRNKEVFIPHLSPESKSPGTTSARVPIPDAYAVSITFTSLIADYANLMVSNYFTVDELSNGWRVGK